MAQWRLSRGSQTTNWGTSKSAFIEGQYCSAGHNDLDMKKAPRRRLLDGVTIVREIDLKREGVGSNNGRTTWKAL